MRFLRALIAGVFIPAITIPLLLWAASSSGRGELQNINFLHFLPLIWGVWNLLYFVLFKYILRGSENVKLMLTGGALGLIVAIIGVFFLNIPGILGLSPHFSYFPLIGAPILYAIIWVLLVKPLNKIVGIVS